MKTDNLNISIIQANLHWEDPAANRAMFSDKILGIAENTDLVVLPEMFTTGFTMNASPFAEKNTGETVRWMIDLAATKDCAITGSIIVNENNNFYNRMYFVTAEGVLATYDKKHTFTLAGEHKTYAAGSARKIVEYKGWKLCLLVCYDLRFPVWARNTDDYDALLYVANWPKKRTSAWDALLKARAIENMAYCIGVNRVGLDGNGHEYVGHSAVYDVLGEKISRAHFESEFTETIGLDKIHIETNRRHLQFLEDRDSFTLK